MALGYFYVDQMISFNKDKPYNKFFIETKSYRVSRFNTIQSCGSTNDSVTQCLNRVNVRSGF